MTRQCDSCRHCCRKSASLLVFPPRAVPIRDRVVLCFAWMMRPVAEDSCWRGPGLQALRRDGCCRCRPRRDHPFSRTILPAKSWAAALNRWDDYTCSRVAAMSLRWYLYINICCSTKFEVDHRRASLTMIRIMSTASSEMYCTNWTNNQMMMLPQGNCQVLVDLRQTRGFMTLDDDSWSCACWMTQKVVDHNTICMRTKFTSVVAGLNI